MGCSQFLWGLMSEFWCSALKTPVAQPCSVSPLPVLLAIRSGTAKCLSQSLSLPHPVLFPTQWARALNGSKEKRQHRALTIPLCILLETLPSFHGPGATGANRAAALGRTRGMDPSSAKYSMQELCASPAASEPPQKGAPTGLHQLIFTESCRTSNWAQQQRHLSCFEQAPF